MTEQSIVTARRSLEMGAALGLPISPMVLGYLGDATVELGDPAGLKQMEEAIALMLEPQQSGALAGSSATIAGLGNNLALARLPIDGPARALEDFERAAAICEARGLREVAGIVDIGTSSALFELGQPAAAIALAQAAADTASGRITSGWK